MFITSLWAISVIKVEYDPNATRYKLPNPIIPVIGMAAISVGFTLDFTAGGLLKK